MIAINKILGGVALFAMLPLPYKFYFSIRAIICLGALYCLVKQYKQPDLKAIIGLLGIAVIYNFFMPIHLSKILWLCVNFATGIFLLNLDPTDKPENSSTTSQ